MEQRWGAWVRWKGLGDLQGIRMEGGPGERTRSGGREGGPRWGFFSDFSNSRSIRERMLAASETIAKILLTQGLGQRRRPMPTLDTPSVSISVLPLELRTLPHTHEYSPEHPGPQPPSFSKPPGLPPWGRYIHVKYQGDDVVRRDGHFPVTLLAWWVGFWVVW